MPFKWCLETIIDCNCHDSTVSERTLMEYDALSVREIYNKIIKYLIYKKPAAAYLYL